MSPLHFRGAPCPTCQNTARTSALAAEILFLLPSIKVRNPTLCTVGISYPLSLRIPIGDCGLWCLCSGVVCGVVCDLMCAQMRVSVLRALTGLRTGVSVLSRSVSVALCGAVGGSIGSGTFLQRNPDGSCDGFSQRKEQADKHKITTHGKKSVSYTHLTLPTKA